MNSCGTAAVKMTRTMIFVKLAIEATTTSRAGATPLPPPPKYSPSPKATSTAFAPFETLSRLQLSLLANCIQNLYNSTNLYYKLKYMLSDVLCLVFIDSLLLRVLFLFSNKTIF